MSFDPLLRLHVRCPSTDGLAPGTDAEREAAA